MKRKIIACAVFFTCLTLLNAAPWEGAAAAAPDGELPAKGFFVATNSFPRNTVVDITNIETNKSTRAIVANGLESPGLLAVVSREAAELIGLRPGSVGRIRMTQPSDPIAYLRFTEGLSAGITEYNPPTPVTEETHKDNYHPYTPPAPDTHPSVSAPPPLVTHTAPSAYLEPEWGGTASRAIVDLPEYAPVEQTPEVVWYPVEEIEEQQPEEVAWYPVEEGEEQPLEEIAELTPETEWSPVEEAVEQPPEEYTWYPIEEAEEQMPQTAWSPVEETEEQQPEIAWNTLEEIEEAPEEVAEHAPEDEFEQPPQIVWNIPEEDEIEETPEEVAVLAPEEEVADIPEYTLVPAEERAPQDIYGIDPSQIIPEISGAKTEPETVTADPLPEIAEANTIFIPDPSFSIPRIRELDRGWYYVQLAAYETPESVESAVSRIDRDYNPVVFKDGDHWYRLLLGPLNQGESAAILQRFKSIGYKDAFVRAGR